MAYDGRVYRVLIASPSDVSEEREAAVRVMQDWNNLHSYVRNAVILPLRWETHTAPEYNVRPQEAINRRIVDDCDMVVGIFWTKLGTPTGEANSGTLEEIERVAKAGKPVMLYFSHVPVDPNRVDLKQMERLKGFKKSVLAHALVETFGSSLDFHDKFASQLELKVRDLQKADDVGQPAPLDLQIFSLEKGELAGSSVATSVEIPALADDGITVDGGLTKYIEQVLQQARTDATTCPIVLAIRNISASGVRNLFVEISITSSSGTFEVSDMSRASAARSWPAVTYVAFSEPSEIERKIDRMSGVGLIKEGASWRYSFEWDALQPQRTRLVKPVTYLELPGPGTFNAAIKAKVYADSFASPVVLNSEIRIDAALKPLAADAVLEKAQALFDQAHAGPHRNAARAIELGYTQLT
jgi:hypothetical protein